MKLGLEEVCALGDCCASCGRAIAGNQERVGEIFRERENKTFAANIFAERVITAETTVSALASTGTRMLAGREFSEALALVGKIIAAFQAGEAELQILKKIAELSWQRLFPELSELSWEKSLLS